MQNTGLIAAPSSDEVKQYLLGSISQEYWQTLFGIVGHEKFTRLKKVKQLGPISYSLGKGSHNRYEHSFGVAYFGLNFLRELTKRAGIKIPERSELVFVIACLCHDLGHGPLSHTFEFAMKYLNQQFDHETAGIEALRSIVYDIGADLTPCEINVIESMIRGKYDDRMPDAYPRFMFQILVNNTDKIDVDKMDYLIRDTKELDLMYEHDSLHELVKKIIRTASVSETMDISYDCCKVQKKQVLCYRNMMFEMYYGCEQAMVYNGLAVCAIMELGNTADIFDYTDDQIIEDITQKFDWRNYSNPFLVFENHSALEDVVKFVKQEVGKKKPKKVDSNRKSIEIMC